jgi:hypothetical protein
MGPEQRIDPGAEAGVSGASRVEQRVRPFGLAVEDVHKDGTRMVLTHGRVASLTRLGI